MAKKNKINLGTILIAVGFLFAIVSLICLAGAGITASVKVGGIAGTATYGLTGFLTGKHTIDTVLSAGGHSGSTHSTLEGGMSYFAIIALVLTVLGIIATIIGVVLKKKFIIVIGGILLLLSGISMFLLKVAGSNVGEIAFVDFFKGTEDLPFNLGAGAICYGVFGLLSGLITTAGAFIKK